MKKRGRKGEREKERQGGKGKESRLGDPRTVHVIHHVIRVGRAKERKKENRKERSLVFFGIINVIEITNGN